MSAHQVITGALNKGDSVFSVGSIEGINFTVCAVGADVVILSSSFERVQVLLSGSRDSEQLVTSVSCCNDSGKIAATYGCLLRIFEPFPITGSQKSNNVLPYRWSETYVLTIDSPVSLVLWSLEGFRILVCCNTNLMIYQHISLSNAMSASNHAEPVTFTLTDEDPAPKTVDTSKPTWGCMWTAELPSAPRFIQYSPDGSFFATSGGEDRMVKIWYQQTECDITNSLGFEFVYLQHPCPVSGFEWRRTGRYMSRRCVQNVLMTWCEDNTVRIWKETPTPEFSVQFNGDSLDTTSTDKALSKKTAIRHSRIRNVRTKIASRLRNILSDKKKKGDGTTFSSEGSSELNNASLSEYSTNEQSNMIVNFHLAASINAQNDCLLVPSLENMIARHKPFTVHWLNNKELVHGIGAEKLLAETLIETNSALTATLVTHAAVRQIELPKLPATDLAADTTPKSSQLDLSGETSSSEENFSPAESNEPNQSMHQIPSSLSCSTQEASSKDRLDANFDMLLKQWNKSSDVLFAIHPVDGSLLSWSVECLDDPHRQPTVSFTSRFPGAFPVTDAASLNPYLSILNPHDPVYNDIIRHQLPRNEFTSSYAELALEKHQTSLLYLLTSHENGSLNLWHLSMEEGSNFSTILNVSHAYRMCGHRFEISQVIAHPVLPLMLTTSQFNTKSKEEAIGGAEMILWRINPIGPLCKSGGVRELARVTHTTSGSFKSIAWIPAILPSCTLGTVCNSPSSCFIATDGGGLTVYQAVIDASGLLAEIYASQVRENRMSSSSSGENDDSLVSPDDAASLRKLSLLKHTFNVVSSQSTAKPGCILRLAEIDDAEHDGDNVLLLHVFNERLLLSSIEEKLSVSLADVRNATVIDRTRSQTFSDRFFIVMIDRVRNSDRLRMWQLDMTSQLPEVLPRHDKDVNELLPERNAPGPVVRSATPVAPSAAQLIILSKKVYDEKLDLPTGVQVISAIATAGHLSSSNLYPTCKAPYVILTACSDERVRFWRCSRYDTNRTYCWKRWKMINDALDSDLEMDGQVYSVSAAHSGRFACAYLPEGATATRASEISSIKVGVFECESSGGVEWLREDTLFIDNKPFRVDRILGISSSSPDDSKYSNGVFPFTSKRNSTAEVKRGIAARVMRAKQHHDNLSLNDLVRIDWVSTENGSHILTIGVGADVYLYTQISQGEAQRNIVMMKEHETHRRPLLRKASSFANPERISTRLVRWMCIRKLELQSADGLPPMPTTLNWVRDGLFIVGMHSEMRCYNQWNFATISVTSQVQNQERPNSIIKRKSGSNQLPTPQLNISPSVSMLDQLGKKQKMDSTNANRQKLLKEMMHRVFSTPRDLQDAVTKDEHVLEAVSDEGLFEAARLASPSLPQYHPKQLIELLNAGKTKRVKAILSHVLNALKQSNVCIPNPVTRTASIRRMSIADPTEGLSDSQNQNLDVSRGLSTTFDDANPDYDELESIAPLPLYLLMTADNVVSSENAEKAANINQADQYESLFDIQQEDGRDNLDDVLNSDVEAGSIPHRRSSFTADCIPQLDQVSVVFTAKHNRALTEILTHTHLPGLSSVDQMHLLAVADTISHFSADVMDKLAQANAVFHPSQPAVTSDAASGYATATVGIETVDECGLRFLMAMKQHEYLLLCLPLGQRQKLRQRGLSSSNIIWALHSETETELLNAIPSLQKSQATWNELRSLGVAWWVKNLATLRVVVEKLAKSAFQQRQDPLDAALFYLAMRKKNVVTHLFKSVRDSKMADFFAQNFNEEKWKKAALKNAFVLMGKQRFQHAAAFFLLSGSLKDAVQTVMNKLHDLQLALVIVRLFEPDLGKQNQILRVLLCREILGLEPEDLESANRANIGTEHDPIAQCPHSSPDPFKRSMAFWHLKEYSRAAETLVGEGRNNLFERSETDCSLSDIFNFYVYLRSHPLVVRQRLADCNVQMGSTEQFLAVVKQLGSIITPSERRLYFRTASAHMASGCPLLALDVLMRLPRNIHMVGSDSFALLNSLIETSRTDNITVEAVDWSAPTIVKTDEIKLEWSESDDEERDENKSKSTRNHRQRATASKPALTKTAKERSKDNIHSDLDIIAQHLKFVAALRIMTEEISTLAGGFEVDGGILRYQLFKWLEKEVDALKEFCEYQSCTEELVSGNDDNLRTVQQTAGLITSDVPLHEAIRCDRIELTARINNALRRRRWLISNQKLLRSFTSYCALHSAQNYRLTSAFMELLLLLLEVQQDVGTLTHLNDPLPVVNSFPLLTASVVSSKMFVSSPLYFIQNQCSDLLLTIAELDEPPKIESSLAKVYKLYNLCQGLSCCLYQSLCDAENLMLPGCTFTHTGILTRKPRFASSSEDIRVTTIPSKWPGVDNLISLLSREKDEEAPQLRLLITEIYIAVVMALFCYAFTAYDSRWLYRLAANSMDVKRFASVFGGGGEKRVKTVAPARPPRPPSVKFSPQPPSADSIVESNANGAALMCSVSSSPSNPPNNLSIDASAFRAKFHSKIFGSDSPINISHVDANNRIESNQMIPTSEQTVHRWIPPNKNIVQLLSEKPPIRCKEEFGFEYDSDEELDENDKSDEEELEVAVGGAEDPVPKEHNNANGFGWLLMKVVLVHQQLFRIRQFLNLVGYDINDLPCLSPHVDAILKLLVSWAKQLEEGLKCFENGCPPNFLPNTSSNDNENRLGPFLRRYRSLVEPGNTPFECDQPAALPVRRLWAYLARQQHLTRIFIRYIFNASGKIANSGQPTTFGCISDGDRSSGPGVLRLVHREHEPILSFACNQVKPGWIVVSTARELQEMDITSLLGENGGISSPSWLTNRTELDVALSENKKDPLLDNDDYILLLNDGRKASSAHFMLKRQVNGIRRLDSHPSLPYYVSGSSDGSIRLWEWGVGQPLFTPRVASQYAKVTKVTFSSNGNKFAAVDGDGLLCLWQASHGLPIRKPFFSQKCHSKSAADVRFLGSTSSIMITAGCGSFDQNVALWDTLLPQSKAMIHCWTAHPEGATSVLYIPSQQAILSGGRHGEICIWDLRQRKLRSTAKLFDNAVVKCLVCDVSQEIVIAGSSDGDIKAWNSDIGCSQLLLTLHDEHALRGGFSLRQVGSGSLQGVQQLYVDSDNRLFSCGADCSLKLRTLPTVCRSL